jgi:sigma-B regulation protein RsbU (phosphoserine phosphatase)
MTPEGGPSPVLPVPVAQTLEEFRVQLGLDVHLWSVDDNGARARRLYPSDSSEDPENSAPAPGSAIRAISPRDGPPLEIEIRPCADVSIEPLASVLKGSLERTLDLSQEIHFFTYELKERYEEINLLYSISETLGSILKLDDAAFAILQEVCDVLGAAHGSLWVNDPKQNVLHQIAAVGPDAITEALSDRHPDAVTSQVFAEGRSRIGTRDDGVGDVGTATDAGGPTTDAVGSVGATTDISVPIRYSPPSGESRTVGVINLFGRGRGDPFAVGDEKLLSAIASQIGAALENNRLIQESLAQERMSHEMELAHHLQMKLLKSPESFDRADVAARVASAEQVGGDFFHVFKLPGGKIGVMIGDVSTHGFPAALIMALSMSAASIYALESPDPSVVLRKMDDALADELETTEMFLSLCYVVIDPTAGELAYSNAGHPHAFVFREGGEAERLVATDPPVGFAGPDSYQQGRAKWGEGDLLLLFTDGLSDTLATEVPGSGEAAVLDGIRAHRSDPAAEIVDALFDLADAATPYIPADDRTAIVLRT